MTKGDLALVLTVCSHQDLFLRTPVDHMSSHGLQWLNHSRSSTSDPVCTKALKTASGALCPSSPQRPASAFSRCRAPDCARPQPPRRSHPLINSTQHHFLHSLTVPSSCACVCVCVFAGVRGQNPSHARDCRGGRKSVGRGAH